MKKNNSKRLSVSYSQTIEVRCQLNSGGYSVSSFQKSTRVSINTRNSLTDEEIYRRIISLSKD